MQRHSDFGRIEFNRSGWHLLQIGGDFPNKPWGEKQAEIIGTLLIGQRIHFGEILRKR
jgi:hypothetical protein